MLAWHAGRRVSRASRVRCSALSLSFSSSSHSPLSKLPLSTYFHTQYVHSSPSTTALTSSDQSRRSRAQAAGPLPLATLLFLSSPHQHGSLRSAAPRCRFRSFRTLGLDLVRARRRRPARASPSRARKSSTSPRSSLAARQFQRFLHLGHVDEPPYSVLHSRQWPNEREWRRVHLQPVV